MRYTEFEESNEVVSTSHPSFPEVPVRHNKAHNSVIFCLELNYEEIEQIKKTGKIYLKQVLVNEIMPLFEDSCILEDLIDSEGTDEGNDMIEPRNN